MRKETRDAIENPKDAPDHYEPLNSSHNNITDVIQKQARLSTLFYA